MLTRDIHDFTLPFLFYYFGYATVLSQSCITGLYASRNTYIRVGVAEWKVTNPVHVVCIHIYYETNILFKILLVIIHC
jgi:hypothetical protein